MAQLADDPARFLSKHLGRDSRVLLINPPVHEKRYHWLRWNQPSELLKLGTWLKRKHSRVDVRLFDFMLPDEAGSVPKHKVKHTWTGAGADEQLWHFGAPFEDFTRYFTKLVDREKWVPDAIIISSLTSYWHTSIESLLVAICLKLGAKLRRKVTIALYGNYPRIEPEHAEAQRDANVAFTRTVQTQGCVPDFGLYLAAARRPPGFYGLDIEDPDVKDHLAHCLDLQARWQKERGNTRPATITAAFFNEDLCGPRSRLPDVAAFAEMHPKRVVIEGIAGIEPRSLSVERLEQLKAAGVRSLFVEHARLAGGSVDENAYAPLLNVLQKDARSRRTGGPASPWLTAGAVTGFVSIGLPDDNMDDLVRTTLILNGYFHAIVLKPFGYSPDRDDATVGTRRARWPSPSASSPQWFPYARNGSSLRREDYDNLVRWQGVLNKRVKGTTFDFLDRGNVARIVRETLVAESWKPHAEAR